ncbi:hypothetical protein LguiB_002142 [Lonicera macranthoides]
MANINIARSVVNVVRTSLGPKGMVKMISSASGGIIITNDGATILKENGGPSIGPQNARLLSSPSHRTSSPNNTTTIDVIVDALLKQCQTLLHAGIHPIVVFNSLHKIYINYQGVMIGVCLDLTVVASFGIDGVGQQGFWQLGLVDYGSDDGVSWVLSAVHAIGPEH